MDLTLIKELKKASGYDVPRQGTCATCKHADRDRDPGSTTATATFCTWHNIGEFIVEDYARCDLYEEASGDE